MKRIYNLLIALLIAMVASATNYYVKPTGSDSYSGSRWSLAKKSLQNTINNASAGDSIFVAVGVYSGGFTMREGVTVMGGYTSPVDIDSKPSRTRILPANATGESQMSILDGGGTQRTLTQIIDFATPTVWDGFVIRNGTSVSTDIAVGSLVYAENGTDIIGIVYKLDGENGKMLSFSEAKKPWGGYQLEFTELPYLGVPANDMNGEGNTQLIIEKMAEIDAPTYYPPRFEYAAVWCKSITGGWHLPSVGEWKEIFAAKSSINNTLIAANAKLANGYWASNHAGELLAWAFYFENGKSVPTLKYVTKSVRAIRSFLKSELSEPITVDGSTLLQDNGFLKHCIVDGKEINTGIKEAANANGTIQIFPNPARCGETITIATTGSGTLQLFDISGKIVFSKTINTGSSAETQTIALESAGVYMLKFNHQLSKIIIY